MLKRTRRRSAQITLVLIGAAALAGCGDDDDSRRDLYASKQDCVQDWGDETKCEPAPAGTTSSRPHSGHGYFWGPVYSGSSYRTGSSSSSTGWTGARSGSRAVSSSSFSRGGFGSSSSSHSSSGS
jgi:uncharacterized protein YgiB involved in biofilm formation